MRRKVHKEDVEHNIEVEVEADCGDGWESDYA